MNTKQLDAAIRAQIDQFLVSISALVRQAAVESVREALGDTSGAAAGPARRGPGRPRKAAGATSAPKATKVRSAAQGKPGRRTRRSGADVEKVAAEVIAYVKAHPGERLEEIGRGLKADTAGLKGPIKGLLASKELRTEGQKRGTRYFAGGQGGAKAKAASTGKRKGAAGKVGKRAGGKAVKQIATKPERKAAKRASRSTRTKAPATAATAPA